MSTTSSQTRVQQTYDFTKRKRWADLLLTELVDNIALILSATGKILYCGNAVTELLGWRAIDLIDIDFVKLVDAMDQPRFLTAFTDSLSALAEFSVLVRLRHRDMPSAYGDLPQPKYVLFDLKFYPHVDDSLNTRCLFAMAVPYPSRNIAMLDTILDLKAENIRLQHMIAERRARLPHDANLKKQPASSPSDGSIYATTSLHTQSSGPFGSGGDTSGAYLPSSASLGRDGTNNGDFSQLAYRSESVLLEEPAAEENSSKKKKLKRTHNHLEQYVCVSCGQTNSPEWRKGPDGPKTLCNACGLRWAKQMRKVDEPEAGLGQAH